MKGSLRAEAENLCIQEVMEGEQRLKKKHLHNLFFQSLLSKLQSLPIMHLDRCPRREALQTTAGFWKPQLYVLSQQSETHLHFAWRYWLRRGWQEYLPALWTTQPHVFAWSRQLQWALILSGDDSAVLHHSHPGLFVSVISGEPMSNVKVQTPLTLTVKSQLLKESQGAKDREHNFYFTADSLSATCK